MEGGRGVDPVKMWGGRGMGEGRRGGGNWEKRRKILQYCIIFYNRIRTKRWEPLRKRAGSGCKRYGRRQFQNPPVSPHDSGLLRMAVSHGVLHSSVKRLQVEVCREGSSKMESICDKTPF